jgi:hypothetical protein
LIGVSYFHVVFTLPHELSALAIQNKRAIYDLLFRASAATLLEVAADPKHLGAEIGFLSDKTCKRIPTCTASFQPAVFRQTARAGFIRSTPSCWPVKVLSRVFRGKFVAGLKCLYRRKKLGVHGNLIHLSQSRSFRAFLRKLFRQDWVVYAKPPFGGPEYVLQYLARYTHRVAISNHRLLALADGKVTFRWKDHAHGNKKRKMTITTDEFLRRFLLHVLPRGFVRIRYFGFLSARWRREFVPVCRQLLAEVHRPRSRSQTVTQPSLATWPCPCCGGAMLIIEKLTAEQIRLRSQEWKNLIDSS